MNKQSLLPQSAFDFTQGQTPLLVSMPHSGLGLTPQVKSGLTSEATTLPDTDWYLPELYDFLSELNVGCIKANYSRYVIDLNRPVDDKPLYESKTTGLFPTILFNESAVFQQGKEPSEDLKNLYKKEIWHAYHTKIAHELARLKRQFGFAILFDAHSIAEQVPMLFDGTLADFNWGTNRGQSCALSLATRVQNNVEAHYSQVLNGRFKGGYITRHFGRPSDGIHAIQLELSQATYLDERGRHQGVYSVCKSKKLFIRQQLKRTIKSLLSATI
ncbi:N-formylglutamate deformylase [Alteromonas sp. 345S023]|uniref:N-formylglutamate deformylase n=1 Tax=Alteromonas profundi TaxID=2696062 RepID=A0A7X5LHX7_9ALTE|nr:N-formylglutamate deformylase [Alteromonas profundi]NDV89649.1 N-formylglutamate deformylase [Alteromonas profundi]